LASTPATIPACLSRRLRFLVLDVNLWLEPDFPRFNFPVAVFVKRLAADLLVLALGTMVTPILGFPYNNPLLLSLF
jgi:hypothetical protein